MTMMRHPPVRQLGLWYAAILADSIPSRKRLQIRLLVVERRIHFAKVGAPIEPRRGTLLHLGPRLGQEPPGKRGVGVEGDSVLPQDGEEKRLRHASDRGVVPLVDGRLDEAVLLGDAHHALHLGGEEVGEAEASEFPLLVELVDGRKGFLVGGRPVGSVEVVRVDLDLCSSISISFLFCPLLT